VRRPAPRPLRSALEGALRKSEPAGTLARVQAVWREVAGTAVAAESEPLSERDGVITVACTSAVWAQELELLGGDIAARLNALLAPGTGAPTVKRLRFVTASGGLP
jgi:predicted nucleic acid-binding Zn ribbon protein